MQLQADAVNAFSPGDIQASSGGANLAGFNLDNTLLGVGTMFQAGKHGEGVIVAMIDGGLRPGFPVISSVIGGEEVMGDGLGYLNDGDDGHGTFVAGLIASHVNAPFPNTHPFIQALNAYAPGAANYTMPACPAD